MNGIWSTRKKHGSNRREVEKVVRGAGKGFPRDIGDDKHEVIGRGQGDRPIRVIFIHSPARVIYPIHAMPLHRRG